MIRQQSTREIERQQSTREESKASMPPIGCALEKAAEYPREWKAAEYTETAAEYVPEAEGVKGSRAPEKIASS
eukprot:scaffold9008_cov123-Skeletonema_marinoi.AAC.1